MCFPFELLLKAAKKPAPQTGLILLVLLTLSHAPSICQWQKILSVPSIKIIDGNSKNIPLVNSNPPNYQWKLLTGSLKNAFLKIINIASWNNTGPILMLVTFCLLVKS